MNARQRLLDPDLVYRRRWLTLVVLAVSVFVIVLDNTILNVALPTLARAEAEGGLAASAAQLQWIVDAYTLVLAGLLLTAGSLGDRFGRYRGLVIGLALFGTGSLLSAMAPSAGVLIATRALMGIGGAFIMPSTLSILTNVFTDPAERAKAIGVWAAAAGLAGLGPLIGGSLLTHFWWGSVFLVNVPAVIGGLVAGYFLVPDSRDPSKPRLDPIGALLSIVMLGTLLWSVIEAPSHGWASRPIVSGFVVGGVLAVAFLVWERRSTHPMFDVQFFRNPRFSAASGAIMLTFLALFGTLFLLTQYFQLVLGYSTAKAGAVLLPQSLLMMVLAPMSSTLVKRFGNKLVLSGGLATLGVTLLLFRTYGTDSSVPHVVGVSLLLAIGMANVMPPATESIMGSLPRAKAGVGSAVNDTTRQMGGAIGVAALGSLAASRFSSELASLLGGTVPSDVVDRASGGLGAAIGVAQDPASQPFASQLVDAARSAYVSAMHTSVTVAAGVILVAAAGVLAWLPARAPALDPAPTPSPGSVDEADALAPLGLGLEGAEA